MKKILIAFFFVALVMSSQTSFAVERHEEPSDMGVVVDVLFLRPAGAVMLVAGVGVFIAALPYSIITNSLDDTSDVLLKRPFEYLFIRDVGDI